MDKSKSNIHEDILNDISEINSYTDTLNENLNLYFGPDKISISKKMSVKNINEMISLLVNIKNKILKSREEEQPKSSDIKTDVKTISQKKPSLPKKTYLLKNRLTGFYKIGGSVVPKFREKTLQSREPDVIMVKEWDADIERKLQKKFNNLRVRGEWFNLTKIQVRFICTQPIEDLFEKQKPEPVDTPQEKTAIYHYIPHVKPR